MLKIVKEIHIYKWWNGSKDETLHNVGLFFFFFKPTINQVC